MPRGARTDAIQVPPPKVHNPMTDPWLDLKDIKRAADLTALYLQLYCLVLWVIT